MTNYSKSIKYDEFVFKAYLFFIIKKMRSYTSYRLIKAYLKLKWITRAD